MFQMTPSHSQRELKMSSSSSTLNHDCLEIFCLLLLVPIPLPISVTAHLLRKNFRASLNLPRFCSLLHNVTTSANCLVTQTILFCFPNYLWSTSVIFAISHYQNTKTAFEIMPMMLLSCLGLSFP